MTRFLAYLSIATIANLNWLALLWFGFGLWPKSWLAFVGFGIFGVAFWRVAANIIDKENKQ